MMRELAGVLKAIVEAPRCSVRSAASLRGKGAVTSDAASAMAGSSAYEDALMRRDWTMTSFAGCRNATFAEKTRL